MSANSGDIALFIHAIRETKKNSAKYTNPRAPELPQLRRLYSILEPMLEKRSLKKAVLQAITGRSMIDPLSGKVSAYQLSVGYVHLLITELEVTNGQGEFTKRGVVRGIEAEIQGRPVAQAWRIFNEQWLQAHLPVLRATDNGGS